MSFFPVMHLFKIGRIWQIAIRTHGGEHLTTPLVLSESNLERLLPALPKTQDEMLAEYAASILSDGILTCAERSEPCKFFSDVTRAILRVEQEKIYGGKDLVIREIIITWLSPPLLDSPPPTFYEEPSEEEIKALVVKWRAQEKGTFPPPAPES